MDVALLIARLTLAAIFAVAAVAKLVDGPGCRAMLGAFGLSDALARPAAIALPLAELLVAVALLPVASAWYGAVAAVGLLGLFTLVIALNLARGRTPDCNCFGQLRAAPIGWSTVARNAALAAVGALLVWNGPHGAGLSLVAWLGDLSGGERLTGSLATGAIVLLGCMAVLLVQVLRQQGRILVRLDALDARMAGRAIAASEVAPPPGLAVGARAPVFRLRGLRGQFVSLEELSAAGKPLLLVFIHPHCGPCQAIVADTGLWQREHGAVLRIALISEGSAAANRDKKMHSSIEVLLQRDREVAQAYRAWGTPAAVVVSSDGNIASSLAQGTDAIRALVTHSARAAHQRQNGANGAGALADTLARAPGSRQLLPASAQDP